MKIKNTMVCGMMATALVVGAVGCGQSQSTSGSNASGSDSSKQITLTQWTYYAPAKLAAQAFEKEHPNIHINVKVFPGNDYETKLQTALSTGTDVPDIFDMDMGYIGQFINTPYLANLSSMGANQLVSGQIPYVAAGGKDSQGNVKAITDTSSPGGFWFRKAAAKKWLGTDDPNKVSQMVSSWPKIIQLGEKINKESGGKVHLLDTDGDVMAVEEYHMQHFVQNGKLVIDPGWTNVLDTMREIYQNNVEADLASFSPGWGSALNDHSQNGSAILFAAPSWAGFMINTKNNAANGQYGLAQAPEGYYEGGRYAAIYAKSPNEQAAYEFLKFLASDDWQKQNLSTGNMPANKSVYQKNMNTYTIPFYGDEKVLKPYYNISMNVPAQAPDAYNEDIISMFGKLATTMLSEKKSDQWVFDQLKQQVKQAYPEVQVN
ncbi:ABC transporter substrate-binding protein [Alicyclobacillus fastidiosus]|uniref:ABC transporter substrate-binding protein n=1 Tax=Alicyclobacillus fastidiosus TaxID=392011 RepID=A0ABV5AA25_9BACL|nr:ABC transporter substrate-binding protein [Alicyclobacillus fastidiosus]WEH07721.1 ABC transporter substrate-binding protein [Alicyclobacillus fastidiosus]